MDEQESKALINKLIGKKEPSLNFTGAALIVVLIPLLTVLYSIYIGFCVQYLWNIYCVGTPLSKISLGTSIGFSLLANLVMAIPSFTHVKNEKVDYVKVITFTLLRPFVILTFGIFMHWLLR